MLPWLLLSDGSGMNNGSDHVTATSAPAQKYVTFDDDIPDTRTYDNSQPFTGTCLLGGGIEI